MILEWVVLLLLAVNGSTWAAANAYEWEDWDYYKILGLEAKRSSYDVKEIRKAYKKQAQQWHPDKVAHKQEKSAVEESNARFARIAEAYQVLSDEDKRSQYDRYLLSQQKNPGKQAPVDNSQPQRQEQQQRSNPFTFPDMADMDPFRMFEEFFFGPDDPFQVFDDLFSNLDEFDQEFQSFDSSFGTGDWFGAPDQVTRDRQITVDPRTGKEILRIIETEEYSRDGYYRVIAQDFVHKWDRFERAWVYQPIQLEPFVIEEGYRRNPQKGLSAPHVLLPGIRLNVGETLENGRYEAGISPTCELWINDRERDIDIWTSETLLPSALYALSDCFLHVKGAHLMLSTRSSYAEQVVWMSPASFEEDFQINPSYLARLDTDGSLAVYRKSHLPAWISQVLSRETGKLGRVGKSVLEVLLSVDRDDSASGPIRLVCISATSPFGCFRIGRWFVRQARYFSGLVQRVVLIIDNLLERFDL